LPIAQLQHQTNLQLSFHHVVVTKRTRYTCSWFYIALSNLVWVWQCLPGSLREIKMN